ncbi:succinate dehydrogenase, cytochrome b556 subunit [Aquipuribacter sp. MA13-6]|uniref:succinate dehydrogenase, cytochrome b556 subunit n=1 Tax=unclassified Aquipuribacter TaxID=2635084 RepID=UPI003EED9AD3
MASTAVNAPTGRKRPQGTLYRGNEGMWSWVLHRITGVVLFFFLLVHVLDTGLVRISPEAYDTVMATYQNPVVGLAELGLVGAFLFHALNGLRVILVDFWRNGPRFHKQMLYGVIGVWVVLMVPFTIRHLGFVFGDF